MGDREGDCLGDGGMVHEHGIDFLGADVFSATVDRLLSATRDEKIAIGIEIPLVTCSKPAAGESGGIGKRIVLMPGTTVAPRTMISPDSPAGPQIAVRTHHGDLGPAMTPTEPLLRMAGGSGLQVIMDVSVVP